MESRNIWLWRISSSGKGQRLWEESLKSNKIILYLGLSEMGDLAEYPVEGDNTIENAYKRIYKQNVTDSKAKSIADACENMLCIDEGDIIMIFNDSNSKLICKAWGYVKYPYDYDSSSKFPHYLTVENWNLIDDVPILLKKGKPKSFLRELNDTEVKLNQDIFYVG